MLFVPIKDEYQQATLTLHRTRQGFVEERTALYNRLRGLIADFERQAAKLEASAHIPVFRRFPPCLTVARDEFQQTVR